MIVGMGIDLCEVPRLAKALERPGFLERFFTGTEAEYIRGRGRAGAESAAGCFAAKEAALKALGTGFNGIRPQDVVILHAPSGQPYYELRGAALARMQELGGRRMHLSMTHEEDMAAAVAILE